MIQLPPSTVPIVPVPTECRIAQAVINGVDYVLMIIDQPTGQTCVCFERGPAKAFADQLRLAASGLHLAGSQPENGKG